MKDETVIAIGAAVVLGVGAFLLLDWLDEEPIVVKKRARAPEAIVRPDVVDQEDEPELEVEDVLEGLLEANKGQLGLAVAQGARIVANFIETGSINLITPADVVAEQAASLGDAVGNFTDVNAVQNPIGTAGVPGAFAFPLVGRTAELTKGVATWTAGVAGSTPAAVVEGVYDLATGDFKDATDAEREAILGKTIVDGVGSAIASLGNVVPLFGTALGAAVSAGLDALASTGEGQKIVAEIGQGALIGYEFQRELFQGDLGDAFDALGGSNRDARHSLFAAAVRERLDQLSEQGGEVTSSDIEGFNRIVAMGYDYADPKYDVLYKGRSFAEWVQSISASSSSGSAVAIAAPKVPTPVETWAQSVELAVAPPEPAKVSEATVFRPAHPSWSAYRSLGGYGPGADYVAWGDLERMGTSVTAEVFVELWASRGVTVTLAEARALIAQFFGTTVTTQSRPFAGSSDIVAVAMQLGTSDVLKIAEELRARGMDVQSYANVAEILNSTITQWKGAAA